MLGTTDPQVSGAVAQIVDYFGGNYGAVLAVVIGIVALFWLVHILMRSVGVRKPDSLTYDEHHDSGLDNWWDDV